MPGGRITVALDTGSIGAGFRALQQLGHDTQPMMRAIGVGLVETTHRRFESGRDPEGQPWKGWSRSYSAVTESRSLLRGKSGNSGLMGSITFAADARSVMVGSNKIYAGVHQFGATIVPKSRKALVFHLGSRVVFAKKVTIPARPYLGFGAADRAVTLEVVHAELRARLLARRAP